MATIIGIVVFLGVILVLLAVLQKIWKNTTSNEELHVYGFKFIGTAIVLLIAFLVAKFLFGFDINIS